GKIDIPVSLYPPHSQDLGWPGLYHPRCGRFKVEVNVEPPAAPGRGSLPCWNMMGCVKPGGPMESVYGVSGSLVPRRRGGMRPVGLLLIAVALMAPGCGGVSWLWSSARTDLDPSARRSGPWRRHVVGS